MCTAFSLDHLIRSRQYVRGNRKADLLGGFEIDHQLEFRRLFDGKVGRLYAFEYFVNVDGCAPEQLDSVNAVVHEAAQPWHTRSEEKSQVGGSLPRGLQPLSAEN